MSMTRRILHINASKTAARCWIPINSTNNHHIIMSRPKTNLHSKFNYSRQFSSQHRCVNFNNVSDASLVSNDDTLSVKLQSTSTTGDIEYFEPTIASSEEVTTASPVNKLD
ncbi:hypothetical protein DFJ63DRAFT_314671 [Scheffersomyces coipomensis]|uniref:uncharacterized protein n=1 Tax=Scheffersomyces coipomensis TaxID=1788519 RepID=UPI00315C51E5